MRALIVENYAGTPLGQVAVALDEAGVGRVHLRPFDGDSLPASSAGFDGLVLLGGAQNALDDANHPWFGQTLDLIRNFAAADKSVLGICLGAQLVARAFGAKNHIGGHYEFGWRSVGLTAEGADDPLFAGLPQTFPLFEWHDDHFSLPEGAARLAGSPIAPNQAFRTGRAVYGTQFHFEADRPLVQQWGIDFADVIAAREPDWPERGPIEAADLGPAADAAGAAIARGWVKTLGR